MSNDVYVVIPARYAASRLPGKPLCNLNGLPMIVRTAQAAQQSGYKVVVAYDDDLIGDVLKQYRIEGVKTRSDHENGTHRLSEVVTHYQWADSAIVVNVQGDEPLLPPALITQVASCLQNDETASVATLATPFQNDENPSNPNMVKVVCTKDYRALYFSRSLLPYVRDAGGLGDFPYLRHIGIYAYRVNTLRIYPTLSSGALEEAEKLEQLRFLEHGMSIALSIAEKAPPAGVDTPEDVARVEAILRA